MNRRKSIKKDYFAIFSAHSGKRLAWSGLFIIAAAALSWVFLSSGDMASEDIVALLAIIIIPLAIIFATLAAFEKITGFTIISGVEWIGKNTLDVIAWCMRNIKQGLGLETRQSNHRVTVRKKSRARVQTQTPPQADVITALRDSNAEMSLDATTEPVFSGFNNAKTAQSESGFGFSAAEAAIETGVIASSQVAVDPDKHEDLAEAKEPEVGMSLDISSLVTDTAVHSAEYPEGDAFNEYETELNTFFPEQDERQGNISIENPADAAAVEMEERHNTQIINENMPEPDYTDQVQQAEISSALKVDSDQQLLDDISKACESEADIQAQQEQPEDGAFRADSLANDADFISRALQAANNNVSHALEHTEIDVEPDTDSDEQAQDNKEANLFKEPDYMIQALQAAKDKMLNSQSDEAGAPDSHASLLDQAEKAAANIISSFTQRFSQSLSFPKPAYQLPSVALLQQHQQSVHAYTTDELDTMSRSVERVLKDYKVIAEVVGAYPGPIITRFELSLAPGIKVSRVSGLAKDLARAMLVSSVRVVEIIEGTPYIGLEIPNQERELVSFREIIASDQFQQAKSPLTLALGKDVSGQTVVYDLAKMPHLLVAGTTGSGKSVAINTMILSMLYKASPDQVRMIMVDPKMLELSVYEGIPHLLTPVVTDMKQAQNALRWAVAEMERRYKLMSKVGVRNLAGFNQKITDAEARGEPIRDPLFELLEPLEEGETFPVLTTLPNIVIVIDELADMMMIVGKKVEELIARLAQKARAAGIHLILATQRPSVDVLTGLIKANVPTRISFQVSSRIDSRTILDQGGAEALLGNGDMLFLPSGTNMTMRSHGAFVDDHEVHAVVDYLKSQGRADYLSVITQDEPAVNPAGADNGQSEVDALYDDAVSFVMETGRASISSVQRRFKVGYNRAARMIDQMEDENIVSEPEGNGSRRLLDRE
ncbi:DNA segregation ATPase FtsK/SpoIIIE, S-DNA-T family [Bathymodiolus japonicus methanotrophic gill symbiont]|uniref:DNA translocase FtsK n=1 Tax=Bathymodiolus japonicus methanotrophic gill symbiont TaxID=113269 RepID=UPI001B59D939|nr:DNA translocase FtsK [Bathymodiolus japonicus methanotrophic gill symbiont]GFO71084.1 DNA segregation ATPase FtsK/SpoIIIE, S-DNA-T family [Bathymodiolus japonicus methanotrophic gill symbiont]